MGKMIKAQPAAPKFNRGQTVVYTDHHDRIQTGKVYAIEANWRYDSAPHIYYTVEHPSYRNRRMYVGEKGISHALQGNTNGK